MTHGGRGCVWLNHLRKEGAASSLIRKASTTQTGLWKYRQIYLKVHMLPGILPGTHADLTQEALRAQERRGTLRWAWQEEKAAVPRVLAGPGTQRCCSALLTLGPEGCLLAWQGAQHRRWL